MPFKYCLAALLIIFLLASCGKGGGVTTAVPVTGSKWTVMVYMAADNSLDAVAPNNLQAMEAVGSTANINVIVEYDDSTTPTRLYKVEKGKLVLLQDLGELDMATPSTLRDFVSTGMKKYPADHYALIIWAHGEGWDRGVDSHSAVIKAVINDGGNNAVQNPPLMANRLVAQGIQDGETLGGAKLDIIGFDACLMATMEAAYEFKDIAGIMVASQDLVQGNGWDYKGLLTRLVTTPTMTPSVLASNMVDSYRQYVESSAYGYGDQTISAIELGSGIDLLAQKVNTMALDLAAKMADPTTRNTTLTTITTARSAVQEFGEATNPATFVDLADFSRLLEGNDSPIQKQLTEVVIAEYHGSLRPGTHGLSIVFFDLPRALAYSTPVYDPNYKNYDSATGTGSTATFINDYSWDEMMHSYYGYQYPTLDN